PVEIRGKAVGQGWILPKPLHRELAWLFALKVAKYFIVQFTDRIKDLVATRRSRIGASEPVKVVDDAADTSRMSVRVDDEHARSEIPFAALVYPRKLVAGLVERLFTDKLHRCTQHASKGRLPVGFWLRLVHEIAKRSEPHLV